MGPALAIARASNYPAGISGDCNPPEIPFLLSPPRAAYEKREGANRTNNLFEERSMKRFRNAAGVILGLFKDAKAYTSKISIYFSKTRFVMFLVTINGHFGPTIVSR